MHEINPEKDADNIHKVESKPGMDLKDLIKRVREKTKQVLAEKAEEQNQITNLN